MTKRILLIDDDATFAKDLADQFKNPDEQFVWVSTGEDALKNIKNVMPTLILLDLKLPTISGLKILEIMKADDTTKFIPTIVLSSFGGEENANRVFELGAVKFIEKTSLLPAQIAQTIREYLPSAD